MKKILIFGSGKVSVSVVDYLYKRKYSITVASNNLNEAKNLLKKYPNNTQCLEVDVTNKNSSIKLVSEHDLVVSMVIPPLHPYIIDYCLECKKDMICSSYLPENYEKIDQLAKEKQISIIFEAGLDPGIDHIVTMEMIDEIKKLNGKVKSLYSHCGGLVVPKDIDNPLSYKFTWSPEGALKAISDCLYLENGKQVHIERNNLLYNTTPLFINNSMNLCYYPNRDSTKYKNKYNVPEVQNLIRGTIRFKGYTEVIGAFLDLGLIEINEKLENKISITEFLNKKIQNQPKKLQNITKEELSKAIKNVPDFRIDLDLNQFVNKVSENENWKKMSAEQKIDRLRIIFDGFNHLKLFHKETILNPKETILKSVVEHLEKYLQLAEKDNDFIIMIVEIEAQFKDGQEKKFKFRLMENGDHTTYTAMAKTVGITSAIATELIITQKITKKGCYGPFTRDVYHEMYQELIKEKLITPYQISSMNGDFKL